MIRHTALFAAAALFATGCAAAPTPTAHHPGDDPPDGHAELQADPPAEAAGSDAIADLAAEELAPETEQAPSRRELPSACSGHGDVCTPPASFAKRLCKSRNREVALAMFRKSAPWTRAYVRQDMEAWYASSRRSSPKQLSYAEEVIIVHSRAMKPQGGFSVSGQGSFDVLRWDGSCVSLMEGELSFNAPDTPDVATIEWKRLDDELTDVLEKNPKIAFRNSKRRKDCKGFGDDVAVRCQRAERGLSRMIAQYVRRGGDIPAPKLVP